MFERLRAMVAPAAQPSEKAPQPVTQIVGGGNIGKSEYQRVGLFSQNQDHVSQCRRWRKIYRRGGPAAACIDIFPQFVLSNGYEFCCEEGQEALKERVIEWADQPHVNFDSVIWQGVLDAVICGTAFQELIPDAGQFGIWGVVPRDASSFEIVYDDYGRVTGYNQIVSEGNSGLDKRVIKIPKERLLSISIFPIPGDMYGASLVERAYDDIMRDCEMIETITIGVKRHGTRKNQVKIGQPGEQVSAADMDEIRRAYECVGPQNDWITGPDVSITEVDSSLYSMDIYSNITLQRLAAAFCVPDEMLGLGRGSTEATANVRLRSFYGIITTIQNILARTYSQKVIDKITGVPGSVWLEFKEVDTKDMARDAAWIAALRGGMDPDAIVPADWAREYMGIPPDADDPLDRVEQVEMNMQKASGFGQKVKPVDIEEGDEKVVLQ